MNILVENAERREYLANNGEWTKNADEGRDFGSTQAAYARLLLFADTMRQ